MTDKDDTRPNLYDLLGVEPSASAAAIRAAYLWHRKDGSLDGAPHTVDAEKLKIAYDILSNAESRRHYDETGDVPAPPAAPVPLTKLDFVIADLLGKAIAQTTSPYFEDLIKRMRTIALQTISAGQAEAAKLDDALAKMSVMSTRIHTTDANNVVGMFVTTWHGELPKMIGEIRRVCQLHEQALQALESYSYTVDAIPDDNI